jgi:hypothetical protein
VRAGPATRDQDARSRLMRRALGLVAFVGARWQNEPPSRL